ncbi:MAG: hypothetical protein ACRD29_10925 [Acidimicrobiales bacterium]
MHPYFVMADRYAARAVSSVAHSALPDAPIQPDKERWRQLRRTLLARRGRSSDAVPRQARVECASPT